MLHDFGAVSLADSVAKADLLGEGARGCKRMQEPGKMSARFRLAEAAGMASDKLDVSAGVFIRMSRHLSSCMQTELLLLLLQS